MTKKQVGNYLPPSSAKQRGLGLEMIKGLLNVDDDVKRISKKQYNREVNAAVGRIDKGELVSHKNALKELAKW